MESGQDTFNGGGSVGFGAARNGADGAGFGAGGMMSPGGQGAAGQMPIISSGTGDVVLTSGGGRKKRGRGWLIAVGVILVVAAVGLGVGAWMMGRGNNNNNDNKEENSTQIEDANLRVQDVIKNYSSKQREIIEIYKDSGDAGVADYVDQTMDCTLVNDNLLLTCNMIRQYYEKVVYEYAFFADAGCYAYGWYDTNCAIRKYGSERYAEVMDSAVSSSAILGRLLNDSTVSLVESVVGDANIDNARENDSAPVDEEGEDAKEN